VPQGKLALEILWPQSITTIRVAALRAGGDR